MSRKRYAFMLLFLMGVSSAFGAVPISVELLPVSKEAMSGPYRVDDLARIYVMVGQFDAAIDQLEFLLSIPSRLSIPLLRLNPAWDPLREHPRFKKLIEAGK